MNDKLTELAIKLREKGFSYRDLEKLLSISKSVIHKWVKLAEGPTKQPTEIKTKTKTKHKILVIYPVQMLLTLGLDSSIEDKAGKQCQSKGMDSGQRYMVFEFDRKIEATNAIKKIKKIHSTIEIKT